MVNRYVLAFFGCSLVFLLFVKLSFKNIKREYEKNPLISEALQAPALDEKVNRSENKSKINTNVLETKNIGNKLNYAEDKNKFESDPIDYELLLKNKIKSFESFSISELEGELEKVTTEISESGLIYKANTGILNKEEYLELDNLLRKEDAIRLSITHKNLEKIKELITDLN